MCLWAYCHREWILLERMGVVCEGLCRHGVIDAVRMRICLSLRLCLVNLLVSSLHEWKRNEREREGCVFVLWDCGRRCDGKLLGAEITIRSVQSVAADFLSHAI